ncbi:MAG: hypothetical protein GWN62_14845 [Aliifodinibius sp.]|nr:hypothetical protein [Fodinibius sp.]
MTFEIRMGSEGILRIDMAGELDNGIVENFRREFSPYVDAATPENPLYNIFRLQKLGKLSPMIRQYLIDLHRDPRFGYSAFINPSRRAKILGQWILKAAKKQNIQFFKDEAEAIVWLQQIID